jgi:hypothetical protein
VVPISGDLGFKAEPGLTYAVTGTGEIGRSSRQVYEFNMAAWMANPKNLGSPIGSFECRDSEPTNAPLDMPAA